MAKVEEVEEEEEEVKEELRVNEAPDAAPDSTTIATPTSAGGGIEEPKDEEGLDAEDGFLTASEGEEGGSDGEEHFEFSETDEETERLERLSVEDEAEGRNLDDAQRSGDGDRDVEFSEASERALPGGEGGEVEEITGEPQQAMSEEDERQFRQQGIDEAMKAKAEGNLHFTQGQYEEAVAAYQRGLVACPLGKDSEDSAVKEIRSVLYSNMAACFSHKQMYQEAVEESTKALELNPNYVKALMRRSQAKEKLELYEDAIVDVKKVLELDPGNTQANISLRTLVPLAEEKRKKLKEEMMAKLKEAGNSILGRFGMSVDNFKTVKDPNTGSYSIQFQR